MTQKSNQPGDGERQTMSEYKFSVTASVSHPDYAKQVSAELSEVQYVTKVEPVAEVVTPKETSDDEDVCTNCGRPPKAHPVLSDEGDCYDPKYPKLKKYELYDESGNHQRFTDPRMAPWPIPAAETGLTFVPDGRGNMKIATTPNPDPPPEPHQARKQYQGRASFDFMAKGEFQCDGFRVTVAGHTIAECEDSEVADWICQQWNGGTI